MEGKRQLTTTLDLSQKAKRAGEKKKRFGQEGGRG